MRNEKGITLIALIIAVLVLITLAAISVSLVMSDIENEQQPVINNSLNYYVDDEDAEEDEIVDTENTAVLEEDTEDITNTVENTANVAEENVVDTNVAASENVVE